MSWRWLRTRLWRLLSGDTPTAILYSQHREKAAPNGPKPPQGRKPLTPQGVTKLLATWADTGKKGA